ncbi:hypothetical protein [Steroidobacter sp.]|uniref:hypothetical protein n=1 Tax=Steroidobacter sp. TaxID=1978227 RepID=UPI002ED98C5C
MPEVVDDDHAQANPELAVLSAVLRGQDEDITKAARIAAVALHACASLDTERAQLYFDLIHRSLSEAARRELSDMLPPNYEYQSEFARKYYGQGKTEGRAEGRRETLIDLITKQLGLRFGPLDSVHLSRINAATSAELEKVAEQLLAAPTLDAALAVVASPQISTAR